MARRYDWLNALGLIAKPDEVPPGWFTAKAIAKQTGRGLNAIRQALRHGDFDRRKFKVQTKRGPYSIIHYRLKQNGAKA